jgi:hypothetical protein
VAEREEAMEREALMPAPRGMDWISWVRVRVRRKWVLLGWVVLGWWEGVGEAVVVGAVIVMDCSQGCLVERRGE